VRASRGPSQQWTGAWRRASPAGRLGLALGCLLVAALAGAFLFGAWHVVVGGLVKGNPRAAAFGIALSTVSAVGLAVLLALVRRVRPLGG
jgi:hypothetical protein